MVLEEFDDCKEAVIEPSVLIKKVDKMPETGVTCFAEMTFWRLKERLQAKQIALVHVSNMKIPVYQAVYCGKEIALFLSDMGAPACVAVLEEVFAMGVKKIVMFGSCGVLDARIEDCSVIIPDRAVRDEGTSFHYAPAADEIAVNLNYMDKFIEILKERGYAYTIGKVWTTDGIYRETRKKAEARKKQGCICVDMECSAVAALAQFRGRDVFQFFYSADCLDGEVWDKRSLGNSRKLTEKDEIALLAVELAVRIQENAPRAAEG